MRRPEGHGCVLALWAETVAVEDRDSGGAGARAWCDARRMQPEEPGRGSVLVLGRAWKQPQASGGRGEHRFHAWTRHHDERKDPQNGAKREVEEGKDGGDKDERPVPISSE